MSPAFWPWLLLGAMWIVLGVLQIAFGDDADPVVDHPNLKWNFGSRFDRDWWQSRRGIGVLYIGFGVISALMHIGDDAAPDLWILQWMGGLLILIGLWSLVVDPHVSDWRQRRHQRRVDARLARGSDAYFEESRALAAYPPARRSRRSRLWFAAMALFFGASSLLLANLSTGGRP